MDVNNYYLMNTINKILSKDINGIIFKYLSIDKYILKNEYLKIIWYFKNTIEWFRVNQSPWKPSYIKQDNKYFILSYFWDKTKYVSYLQ